jgi:hypothetical protein
VIDFTGLEQEIEKIFPLFPCRQGNLLCRAAGFGAGPAIAAISPARPDRAVSADTTAPAGFGKICRPFATFTC